MKKRSPGAQENMTGVGKFSRRPKICQGDPQKGERVDQPPFLYEAEVDLNLVMTGKSQFVEIQGTAEKQSFSPEQLQAMLELGKNGIALLVEKQKESLINRSRAITHI